MGIFSSKYKTYVGTSISRFADTEAFLSSKKKGLISGIARNEDITDHTLDSLINSSGFRAKKAFRYAGDSYTFGRPSDTIFSKDGSDATTGIAIENYLNTLGAINIFYTKYGVNNYFHKLYKLLHNSYNFNFNTGELTTLSAIKGSTVTLTNLFILNNPTNLLEDADSFSSIDFYITEVIEEPSIARLGAKISYTWELLGVSYTEDLVISDSFFLSDEELKKTVFMAAYENSTGDLTFFDYGMNSGISSLDNVFETSYDAPGDYLPRLYFRWNHTSEGTDKNSIAYTNGKRLAKKIGLDYDDLIDSVHKLDADRTQEDLDKIRSVFLTYALPADAIDQVELNYLFKHFKNWYGVIDGTVTTESLEDFNTNYQLSDSKEHVLVIEDKRFKITIGMQGIWKRTVTGTFDSVGKYGALKGELTTTTVVGESITTVRTFPWHVYRHQTSETTYEEYHVVGLETKYYVEGDHTSASGYTKDVEDAKDILYVPINYSLIDQFTLFEQEELIYKSMQIVANSLVVVKVKWYQRSGWSTLFKIAAIVAAFYGFTQGLELLSALATIATVSIAWALELVFAYLVDYLTSVIAIKLFVKAAGEEIALLTAIVLAATGYIQGGGFKSPFATQMLQYSNSIFAEMNASFMREIESLKDDYNSFITEAKTEFKEISDELKKFDNPNKNLTAYLLNSTPEEFLNKTHIGNIGTKVFDVTRNYVDISLRLPYRPTYSEV